MPKYLFKVNYTLSGIGGLRKEGGSSRRDVAKRLIESAGGTMESMYFAFGPTDLYIIAELPDNLAAANVATSVSASGAVTSETVALLTSEELDEAVKRSVEYRPATG